MIGQIKLSIFLLVLFCSTLIAQVEQNDTLLHFFNERISENPRNSAAIASRAFIYANLKEYKKALKDIDRAIELRKESPTDTFHIFKAEIHLMLGQEKSVLTEAKKALEINYGPRTLFYILEFAFVLEQYDLCIEYANEYLQFVRDNEKVYYYRGSSLMKGGALDSLIIYDLQKALKLTEQETDTSRLKLYTYFQLGRFFHKRMQWDSAISYYNRILNTDDSLVEEMNLFYEVGECYFYSHKYDKAITMLSMHTSIYKWHNNLYLLGRSNEYLDSYKEAIDYYSVIIEDKDKENLPYATLHRGICFLKLGDSEQAIRDLKKAKGKWYEEDPLIYLDLSQCYLNLGKIDKSCKYLREGLRLTEKEDSQMINQFQFNLANNGCK
jgi:tetratricopeptide (TPR) repeat protein